MTQTTRRAMLVSGTTLLAAAAVGFLGRIGGVFASGTIVGKPGKVTVVQFDDAGKLLGPATLDKIVQSEEAWQASLASAEQANIAFYVTRQEGTERAFSGPHWDRHDAGLYRCVCCDNALFTNDTKYDSGTGWPSFWQPIAKENVAESSDSAFGMVRTAVACALCDAHLGHVFDDGPQPTGLRYCMNGVALRFIPASAA